MILKPLDLSTEGYVRMKRENYADVLSAGRWSIDWDRLCLVHSKAPGYDVDLEKMTSSPRLLDTIFQVCMKTWNTDADRGQFLRLIDLLIDPQGVLCSFGAHKKLPKSKLRKYLLERKDFYLGEPVLTNCLSEQELEVPGVGPMRIVGIDKATGEDRSYMPNCFGCGVLLGVEAWVTPKHPGKSFCEKCWQGIDGTPTPAS